MELRLRKETFQNFLFQSIENPCSQNHTGHYLDRQGSLKCITFPSKASVHVYDIHLSNHLLQKLRRSPEHFPPLNLEAITYSMGLKSVAFFSIPLTKFSFLLHFFHFIWTSIRARQPCINMKSHLTSITTTFKLSFKTIKIISFELKKIFLFSWLKLGMAWHPKFCIFQRRLMFQPFNTMPSRSVHCMKFFECTTLKKNVAFTFVIAISMYYSLLYLASELFLSFIIQVKFTIPIKIL